VVQFGAEKRVDVNNFTKKNIIDPSEISILAIRNANTTLDQKHISANPSPNSNPKPTIMFSD